MTLKILIQNAQTLINRETVFQCLSNAAFPVNFYNKTGPDDLYMLDAQYDRGCVEVLAKSFNTQDIGKVLQDQKVQGVCFLGLAQLMLDNNPAFAEFEYLCMQNPEPHPLGGFVYALLFRVAGKRRVVVNRSSNVWNAGVAFPVRPQV